MPNNVGTLKAPMQTKRGIIPWADSTSRFAVRNAEDLTVFIDCLREGSRNSLFSKFGLAPLSAMSSTMRMALGEIPIDIRTREVALRRNDEPPFQLSSHCTFIEYVSFSNGDHSCSLADESALSIPSMFTCVAETILPKRMCLD